MSHKLQIFVAIFIPLFVYCHAQFNDWGGSLRKVPDPFPWEEDASNEFRYCGCGGDRCERLANCRTKGYNPICCSNICRCIDSGLNDITDDKDKQCQLCETTQDLKTIKIGKVCRNATRNEFNCWKKHPQQVEVRPDLSLIYEYTYS